MALSISLSVLVNALLLTFSWYFHSLFVFVCFCFFKILSFYLFNIFLCLECAVQEKQSLCTSPPHFCDMTHFHVNGCIGLCGETDVSKALFVPQA